MRRHIILVLALAVACSASPRNSRSAKRSSMHRGDATAVLALSPRDWRPITLSARTRLDQWRSTLFARTMTMYRDIEQAIGSNGEPPGPFRFELFSPFIKCPDNHTPVRFGADEKGRGGVLLCADLMQELDCVVFLSGVGNHTLVTKDIFKRSQCSVVSFDCGRTDNKARGRHVIVNKCLGTQSQQAADPNRWTTVENAVKSFELSKVDALIVNIEGAEYDVFSEWNQTDPNLPRQVSMELHYDHLYADTPGLTKSSDHLVPPLHAMTMSDLALFMLHMTGAGFGIASRENSLTEGHASSFTFVRVT